jgi:hypothetical protein
MEDRKQPLRHFRYLGAYRQVLDEKYEKVVLHMLLWVVIPAVS